MIFPSGKEYYKGITFSAEHGLKIYQRFKTQTRRVMASKFWNAMEAVPEPAEYERICHSCPYGGVGRKLWVREPWKAYKTMDAFKPSKIQIGSPIEYVGGGTNRVGMPVTIGNPGKYRNSRFMCRWMSRNLLQIDAVGAEKLHDITDEEIKREGVHPIGTSLANLRPDFMTLWDSISGSFMPWSANPWVWVISFHRIMIT